MSSGTQTTPHWQIRGGRLLQPAPFIIVGIVNITPDSFSDGGCFANTEAALNRVRTVLAEGAHMVDLGAESTRPGAQDIGPEEEWRRLEPVLQQTLDLREALARQRSKAPEASRQGRLQPVLQSSPPALPPFTLSIDSFRAENAARALALSPGPGAGDLCGGVDVINDVSGGSFDPTMDEVLAQYKPGYVLGHSPARPLHMQRAPYYDNVVDELLGWFSLRMKALVRAGLPEACICLDPCIGFGKSLEHTLEIIEGIPRLLTLGRPLYFGISRKSFLGAITGQSIPDRDTSTQVATALLAAAGVAIHRVHQVADTAATLKLVQALTRKEKAPLPFSSPGP